MIIQIIMIIHIRDCGNLGNLPFVKLFGAVRADICRVELGPSMLVLRCWLLLLMSIIENQSTDTKQNTNQNREKYRNRTNLGT